MPTDFEGYGSLVHAEYNKASPEPCALNRTVGSRVEAWSRGENARARARDRERDAYI